MIFISPISCVPGISAGLDFVVKIGFVEFFWRQMGVAFCLNLVVEIDDASSIKLKVHEPEVPACHQVPVGRSRGRKHTFFRSERALFSVVVVFWMGYFQVQARIIWSFMTFVDILGIVDFGGDVELSPAWLATRSL